MTNVEALRPTGAVPMGNYDAEHALLGVLLYENSAFASIGLHLRGEHFVDQTHGAIFDRIAALIGARRSADMLTVDEALRGSKSYQDLGGLRFLGDLTEQAPASSNAPEYARIIFDMSQRRDLIHLCQEMGGAAMRDRETPAFSLAAELRAEAEIIESASAPEDATMIAAPALAEKTLASLRTLMQEGKPRGRMTGLRCFDRRLGGLKPGSLVVIGGRPSMGKTSLARAALHGAAVRSPDHTFLFLSIEMGDEEMMQRELAAMSHDVGEGIEYRAMGSGKITPFDMMVLERLRHPANLVFDDCASAPSLDDVRRKIWSKARKGKVGAVVIDYLQLMRRPEARGRNEASVLGEMTMGLKHLARQAETCIILLSQLSRQVEQRDDKKPQLSDLRDSGSIEQDADAVLFPFREFYYVERAKPADSAKSDKKLEWDMRCEELRRKLEVICAKQRQGPAGYDLQRYFAEFDHIADEGADQ